MKVQSNELLRLWLWVWWDDNPPNVKYIYTILATKETLVVADFIRKGLPTFHAFV